MSATAAPATRADPVVLDPFAETRRHANRLPPDLSYCLDAEVEWGQIGGDERAYVDLFMPDAAAWFRSVCEDGNGFPAAVTARYAAWRQTASPEDAMAVDWVGLDGLRWFAEDCVLGIRNDLAREKADFSEADIVSRLPDMVDGRRIADRFSIIARRCAEDVARWGVDAFMAERDRAARLYEERRPDIARREAEIKDVYAVEPREGVPPSGGTVAKRESVRESKRTKKFARRALARSYRLLEDLAGRPRAQAWLSGDTATVEGRKFDFRLRVRDPKTVGHGALDVSVADKDGVLLAHLCVYATDTPALDQVAGMLLHVVAGEEDEILRKANVIISTEAAHRNAGFEAIYRPKNEEALREVRELLESFEEEVNAMVAHATVRSALATWLGQEALAPLTSALGGVERIRGILPAFPMERIAPAA